MKKILIITTFFSTLSYSATETTPDPEPQLLSIGESFGPSRENFGTLVTSGIITVAGTIGTILLSRKAHQLGKQKALLVKSTTQADKIAYKKARNSFWKRVAASVGLSLVTFIAFVLLTETINDNTIWRKQSLIRKNFREAIKELAHKDIAIITATDCCFDNEESASDSDSDDGFNAINEYEQKITLVVEKTHERIENLRSFIKQNARKWATDYPEFKKALRKMNALDQYLNNESGKEPFSDFIHLTTLIKRQEIANRADRAKTSR